MTTTRQFSLVGGAVAAASMLVLAAAPAGADTPVSAPAEFTSAFTAMATPEQVVDADGVVVPGQEGATGSFTLRINSEMDIVCYDITFDGVSGDYMSPAKTATHLHEAAAGEAGPPRLAFPDPTPVGDGPRTSSGCMQGPFTTGLSPEGTDTGEGFDLAAIEANPAGFAADSHTVDFSTGVVRGQLTAIPVGGIATGGGGTAGTDTASVAGIAVLTVAAIAGVGVVARRRSAGGF